MSYSLNADQLAIQDLIRRVAQDKVAARADAIDRAAEYPQDMFELLKDLGLFALPFPEKYGGTGSLLSGCLAVEEFGRVCYNTGYLLVVQWVAFGALLAAGSEEQHQRFLPAVRSSPPAPSGSHKARSTMRRPSSRIAMPSVAPSPTFKAFAG